MLNSVDLVPHRGSRVMVPLCLRRPKIFSRVYFVGTKFFLVGVSWARIFLSPVFGGSKFFFVGISWVQRWAFRVSRFFSRGCFVDPKFFLVGLL